VLSLALVALVAMGAWVALGGAVEEKVACAARALGGSGDGCGARGAGPRAREPAPTDRTGPGAALRSLLPDLPASVIELLRDQGTEIALAPGGLGSERPDLAGQRPRGWPEGTTFGHDGRGLYDPSRNQIVVALGRGDGDAMFSDAYVLAHEIGHAIDLPRGLSSEHAFVVAFAASALENRSRAAMEETFADSFAMFVTDRAALRAQYPELARYWDAHIDELADASPSLLDEAGDVIRPFGWDDLNPINQAKRAGAAAGRFATGGAHALRDAATGTLALAGMTMLAGADAMRGTYEIFTGNYSGSTAARTRDPYAKWVAASFEEAGRESRRMLRETPESTVLGVAQIGRDIASGDPYRMGYGLTTLGITAAPIGRARAGLGARSLRVTRSERPRAPTTGGRGWAKAEETSGAASSARHRLPRPRAGLPLTLLSGDDAILLRMATRLRRLQGYHDVVVHGGPDTFEVTYRGETSKIDGATLADYLRTDPRYTPGENVRLIACESACGTAARDVANNLGVSVLAPDVEITVLEGGRIRGRTRGHWLRFRPGVAEPERVGRIWRVSRRDARHPQWLGFRPPRFASRIRQSVRDALGDLLMPSAEEMWAEAERIAEARFRAYQESRRPPPSISTRDADLRRAAGVLGIRADATLQEANRAWRALAARVHPDINPAPDATARMQEINAAHEMFVSHLRQRP